MVQASFNIDLDTLADDVDSHTWLIRADGLPAITYNRVLPRFIDLLDRHGVTATFFVIGRDIEANAAVLRQLAEAGHELANHTMHHDKQLVNLAADDLRDEIVECDSRLSRLAGGPIAGFRAPGYTVTPRVIAVLRSLGYRYDTSLNGSLAYSATKRLFKAVRLQDKSYVTCQPVADHFGPRNPYRMGDSLTRRDPAGTIIEIPVSVIPLVHYPFVTSVLLPFGLTATLWGLDRLIARGRFVNCGFHVNEFTDPADVAGRSDRFYYTSKLMRTPLAERMRYFDTLIAAIKARCEVVLLRDVAA
ncbi:MAG: polysaccharide deacetylase family protein [Acidobacteriota bacterium]|nr:polysaccharide deacetylase family protein [Acidobacteriota bacterium]